MRKVAFTVLTLILFLVNTLGAGVQEPRDGFEKKAMNATFALYLQRIVAPVHAQAFACSATAILKGKDGYFLLSAGHCVSGEPSDVTFAVAEQIGGPLYPVTPISARLSGVEDYSLFYLKTAKLYPVIELGDEVSEHIGDEIINPNFTEGLVKQLAYGHIASGAISDDTANCVGCAGYIILHETAGPGASGSAVISGRTHKIIGIVVVSLGEAGLGFEPISTVRKAFYEPNQYTQLHQVPNDDN